MSSFAAASAQKFAFRAAPAKTVANKKIAQRSSRRVASLRVEAAKKSVGDLAKGDLEGNNNALRRLRFYSSFSRGGYRMSLDFWERGGGASSREASSVVRAKMHRSRVYPMPL
jgi:hypothetical protein